MNEAKYEPQSMIWDHYKNIHKELIQKKLAGLFT